MLLRYLLPRRKENVFNFGLFALIVCGCIWVLSTRINPSHISKRLKPWEILVERHDDEPLAPGLKYHVIPDYSIKRHGVGENGKPVHLAGEEKKAGDKDMKKWFMNVVASDKISLDRSIPDTRHQECKSVQYPRNLPNASVVIIFHEEAWTPLLRTVHSVINRSPPHLLHEVVLLDDASSREELKGKLSDYVKIFRGKVKLVRVKQRQGLVRARLEGAKAATGQVLVFLDSHCEANSGWLEPLLSRIHEKRSAVLCPIIDMISDHSLSYYGTGASSVGGFWWSLHFKWTRMQKKARDMRKSQIDPMRFAAIHLTLEFRKLWRIVKWSSE